MLNLVQWIAPSRAFVADAAGGRGANYSRSTNNGENLPRMYSYIIVYYVRDEDSIKITAGWAIKPVNRHCSGLSPENSRSFRTFWRFNVQRRSAKTPRRHYRAGKGDVRSLREICIALVLCKWVDFCRIGFPASESPFKTRFDDSETETVFASTACRYPGKFVAVQHLNLLFLYLLLFPGFPVLDSHLLRSFFFFHFLFNAYTDGR